MCAPGVATAMPATLIGRLAVLLELVAAAAAPLRVGMDSAESSLRSPRAASPVGRSRADSSPGRTVPTASNDARATGLPTESDPPEGRQPESGTKPPGEGDPNEGDPNEGDPAEGDPAEGDPSEGAPPDGTQIEAGHAQTWALVRAASEGDGEAFGKLYDLYVDPVFRFIYYRVSDRALAEDFTSETFLRALRRISTVNYQGRDIGAWFMTIARNIVLDHVKSARFRLESTTAEIREGTETADSPEAAVLTRLTNVRLLEAVNTLGEEQRECIVLRFLNGFSVAETAAVMGKNDGAIKALQHRAVKRLAAELGDELR